MTQNKPFRPMLLSNKEYCLNDLNLQHMSISKKRDGVRCEVTSKGLYNRSMKRLKNEHLQNRYKELCKTLKDNEILECEIYAHGTPCRTIAGICNSNSKTEEDIKDFRLYAFDYVNTDNLDMTKEDRFTFLKENFTVPLCEQYPVKDIDDIVSFYEKAIEEGYEGVVLMDFSKPYKEGRVTIRQHIGYKIKPERTDDLEIIDVTERMENTNESQTNELGHLYKRNTVDAKRNTGIAATFICKLPGNETTRVTCTGTEDERREIWENRADYIGRYVVVKSMDYGTKDKLRHPRMIGIKEKVEK